MELSTNSKKLFEKLVHQANEWSGVPLFDGNAAAKGNLTDLKKKGLLTTDEDEGLIWVFFTMEGKALARELFQIEIQDQRG